MTATAFDQLRSRVLGLVAARDLDVAEEGPFVRQVIEAETERFQRELMRGSFDDLHPFANPPDVVDRLVQELTGIGAQLDQLVADPNVEEIYGVDGEITIRMAGGKRSAPRTRPSHRLSWPCCSALLQTQARTSMPRTPRSMVFGSCCRRRARPACQPRSHRGSMAPSRSV